MKLNKWVSLFIALMLAVSLLVIGFLLVVTHSWAWQSITDEKRNDLPIAGVRAKIEENFEKPADGVRPGKQIKKEVTVRNDAGTPVFVRVMVLPVIQTQEQNGNLPQLLSPDVLKLEKDSTLWMDGGDGYYYYRQLLAPGTAALQPLLYSVMLEQTRDADYDGAELTVHVTSEVCGVNQNYGYRMSFWAAQPAQSLQGVDALFRTLTDVYYTQAGEAP